MATPGQAYVQAAGGKPAAPTGTPVSGLSQDQIAAIAKSSGLDPNLLAGITGLGGGTSGTYNPWDVGPQNFWTATLYTGSSYEQPPMHPGLPDVAPRGNKVYHMRWGGRLVDVSAPDFGGGVHVAINSDVGENPSQSDLRRANQNTQVWLEIRDAKGKALYRQNIQQDQQNVLLTPGENALFGSPDITLRADPYAQAGPRIPGHNVIKTSTVEGEIKSLYDMDPKQLWDMKNELWLSGYYPSGMKLADLNQNSLTNDDIAAFAGVMMAANRYYEAGKNLTWQDLLHWQAADPAAKKKAQVSQGVVTYSLSDPAAITKAANDAAVQILGRTPSSDDVSTLVSLIHSREMAQQKVTNVSGADQPTGGTTTNVDPQADVEQYFRQHYPNEAMAVDWGSQAQVWNDALSRTSPQPPIVGAASP